MERTNSNPPITTPTFLDSGLRLASFEKNRRSDFANVVEPETIEPPTQMKNSDPNPFRHLHVDHDQAAIRSFFRFYWIDWAPARKRSLEQATGLPRSGQIILQILFQETRMTTTALAARLMIDRSTLSRQLRPLKEAGLIEAKHVGGGRRTELTITDEGKAQAVVIDELVMRGFNDGLSRIDPSRVHQLAETLDEFRDSLLAIAKDEGWQISDNEFR